MSRLDVPLIFRKLSTTGDVLVRAELRLAIKTDRVPGRRSASSLIPARR